MRTKQVKVSDQLRAAIDAAPISRYRLAKLTGLDQALLSRFLYGQCGLSLESVDLLCEALGLELKAKGVKHGDGLQADGKKTSSRGRNHRRSAG